MSRGKVTLGDQIIARARAKSGWRKCENCKHWSKNTCTILQKFTKPWMWCIKWMRR